MSSRPPCGWCEGSIPAPARRDSIYCSQRCRQAANRFHRPARLAGAALPVAAVLPRRFAYADPPYPGLARRYYGQHPDFAGEVDYPQLIASLLATYDGWAVSTSAATLPQVLASCPPGVRIAAWFRGERPTVSYSPLSAWEPVIYYGARRLRSPVDARRVDALVHFSRPRLTDPRRVTGAKPAAFCAWLFQLLGATAADELVDLFPGSRGVGLSWETYRRAAAERDASLDREPTGRGHQVDVSSRPDPATRRADPPDAPLLEVGA